MLDLLVNAPTEVKLGARTYLVAALKLRQLGYLPRWVRAHSARPTEVARESVGHHPPEERREVLKAGVFGEHDWPPSIGTDAASRVLFSSSEGLRYFVAAMLAPHQPELSSEQLDEILGLIGEEEL